ncbi:Myo-inositol 2-dehydrogenase [Rubellimicrobium mesophilum DSM 19309]|uniref:Myo-inositol 2-dehydrogenase n=1 Tax=Rubellimicrobium mesophilum DSM 19309 TaxID=442562 RepID=A0A017HNF3_9RHOB|nr:Gfo/Idh/MocA family oxidoreductase [Rubellimicrobium mesophilum]EYD75901.1 Myo-inositol 2-dehydrogenase [Rubellimicrobium mesophilum DSM 19309]
MDAVTVTTPPETRRELVLEAIAAGLHVIADKPFAPSAEGGRELEAAAKAKGVILSVFHNRRWDSDMRTLRKVVSDGCLGPLWRVHSRMDLDQPSTLEAGPTGGLLRDLGSHLVDQMLWLLGPVRAVDAQLDFLDLPQGRTDAGFTLTLRHESGTHSHLSASKLNRLAMRELRAYGQAGSYVASSTDVQAQSIFAGRRPTQDLSGWGFEPRTSWGILRTAAGEVEVPAEQGRYHDFYAAFAHAIHDGAAAPVTAAEDDRCSDRARRSPSERPRRALHRALAGHP